MNYKSNVFLKIDNKSTIFISLLWVNPSRQLRTVQPLGCFLVALVLGRWERKSKSKKACRSR